MSEHYDREGRPISMAQWAILFGDKDYQRVKATEIGDVTVSTVWLGMNHQWGDGPPLIFETLVFNGPHDGEMARYSTEAAALEGHKAMCEQVRS